MSCDLKDLSTCNWRDVIRRFNPGDRVRVLSGDYMGRSGAIEGLTVEFDAREPGGLVSVYSVELDGDTSPITLRWGQIARQP